MGMFILILWYPDLVLRTGISAGVWVTRVPGLLCVHGEEGVSQDIFCQGRAIARGATGMGIPTRGRRCNFADILIFGDNMKSRKNLTNIPQS